MKTETLITAVGGVAAIAALYLMTRGPTTQPNAGGQGFNVTLGPGAAMPGAPALAPFTFNVPALSPPSSTSAPGGSTLVFNFTAPTPMGIEPPFPVTAASGAGGAGSPDGSVTGPCNCPTGGTEAYGTPADAAAAMFAALPALMSAALNERNIIEQQVAATEDPYGLSPLTGPMWGLGGGPAQGLFNRLQFGAG